METLSVYTDGSHFKGKDHIGMGAVCEYQGVLYRYSANALQSAFKSYYKCDDDVSNPTAEMAAAAGVLRTLKNSNTPIHIEIIADYIGVREWNEFYWKAKKAYIYGLVNVIKEYTSTINRSGGRVTYRHIPGHQKGQSTDARMNNESDKMAKSLEDINEFVDLVSVLNTREVCTQVLVN